jgi:flagellar hook-associated protein 2
VTIIPSTNIGLQTPTITDTGLVGNFNAQAIISAEMQQYEQPIVDLQHQQSTLNANVSDYQQINSDLASLETAARALAMPSDWQQMQATSSDTAVATASAQQGTPAGSVEFTVSQLAAAESMVSAGSVASTSDVITSSPDFLLSQGGAQIGFAQLASQGLTLGQHTVQVTQASEAALATGTTDLAGQSSGITIGSSNDTVDVAVDGTAYALSIAASPSGGYSGSGLLAAVQSAISAAGASGVLQAGYNGSGQLVLSTVDQGSSQTLQVTGGTALATLGLATMSSASSGVDGVVSVDGTSTTLSTVAPGQQVSLSAPTGSVLATVVGQPPTVGGSLLQVGSVTATDVSTGNGSLADLVANINAAGSGITAAALETSSGSYVLQLSSSKTGVANDLSVDTGAFSGSSLGNLQVATQGADAEIQIGGTGGYTLTSSSDTFTGLLPGLSVTAQQVSSTPVTVTVGPDAKAMAADVNTLVTAANTVLTDVQKYAGYNETTKTGGPLMGSAVLENLPSQIQAIIASTVGTSTLGNAENLGLTVGSDGSISFDQSTFEQAYAANPTQVANMFTQGGTFNPSSSNYAGQVSVSGAGTDTQAGAYAVTISQSAAQAVSDGSVLSSGTVSAAETLTIAMGGQSVSYTTTAGEALSQIASGINQALASAGMAMSAQVVDSGQQLQLASSAYGSAASFSVTTTNTASGTTGLAGPSATAGTPTTFTGTNVAGTIDGVTATGNGQYLTVPTGASSPAAGLSLQVTTPGITTSTNLGTLTYTPGIAQSLVTLADSLSNPVSGAISQTIKSLQTQSQGLTSQIDFYGNIAAEEQKMLTTQFSNLETVLAQLQNQSSSLSSALSGLQVL